MRLLKLADATKSMAAKLCRFHPSVGCARYQFDVWELIAGVDCGLQAETNCRS